MRVGSFSNLDRILPHYTLEKAASPLPLPKAASEPRIESLGRERDALWRGVIRKYGSW